MIAIEPISGALGAEIFGVDIAEDLDNATIGEIRQALLDHCVIFFRDQTLDTARLKAFASRFGEIFRHPNFIGWEADPAIVEIRREPGDQRIVGENWHTDATMVAAPPMGSILYGVEIPAFGNDTLFSNLYLAYETLSDGMRRLIANLKAVHSDRKIAGPRARGRSTKQHEDWQEKQALHPLVRTHPETGRKLLFASERNIVSFEGMTEAESGPLLHYLSEHAHRPEFTCRFRWRTGSVAFWDNRCTQHIALNDRVPSRRVMQRVQFVGDRPY
ncbi:MAG TPA: TauD/TfdA family dioxygenase [Beijerinckiaceae bacterium]|nr:TauD/TfdA family dioxygenase [Beijerinckiaceae bacterium]